jgi:hypothetical protein
MPPAGFELAIPASEQPQTHALDRAATGIAIILPMLHVSNIITRRTSGRSLETLKKQCFSDVEGIRQKSKLHYSCHSEKAVSDDYQVT